MNEAKAIPSSRDSSFANACYSRIEEEAEQWCALSKSWYHTVPVGTQEAREAGGHQPSRRARQTRCGHTHHFVRSVVLLACWGTKMRESMKTPGKK